MTDSGKQRPRRAFAADDAQPDGHDDTRNAPSRRARRVADEDFEAQLSSPSSEPSSSSPSEDAAFQPPVVPATETAIPAPVLPSPEYEPGTAASVTSGWESLTVPTGQGADPSPSATASGPEPITGQAQAPKPRFRRRAAARASAPDVMDLDETVDVSFDSPEEPPAPKKAPFGADWISHHKKTLLLAIAGGLSAVLLIAGGFFLFSRMGQPDPNADLSASPSASPIPLSEDTMIGTEDAALIEANADWSITETSTSASQITKRGACLGADPSNINAVSTMQRLLGTTQEDNLALMHQVDVYASDKAAEEVYQSRVADLTTCSQVPALLTGASEVTGLGDAVTQVSVAFENDPTQYHTVLLVRSGRVLQLLDIARNGSAIPAEAAVAGLTGPLTEICSLAGSTCPASPTTTATAPLAADPVGWLIPSDLPRITPGHGTWSAPGNPVEVSVRGSGCENLPLATEPGPTNRMQRTLVMTADANAPTGMGVDEVLFSFADTETATAFGDRLASNIASCADNAATATVTELEATSGIAAGDTTVTARLFTVAQQTADDTAAHYQLVVAQVDTKVSYLLATVGENYQFSQEQLAAIAIRAGQRAIQG